MESCCIRYLCSNPYLCFGFPFISLNKSELVYRVGVGYPNRRLTRSHKSRSSGALNNVARVPIRGHENEDDNWVDTGRRLFAVHRGVE